MRADELRPVDAGTVLIGIARAVDQPNGRTRIPGDDAIHRPATKQAVAMENRQVVIERHHHAVSNVEIRWAVVVTNVLYVGCRNSPIPRAEDIAELIQRLRIGVVCVERQAMGKALAES